MRFRTTVALLLLLIPACGTIASHTEEHLPRALMEDPEDNRLAGMPFSGVRWTTLAIERNWLLPDWIIAVDYLFSFVGDVVLLPITVPIWLLTGDDGDDDPVEEEATSTRAR
jgi:hypothetical protein